MHAIASVMHELELEPRPVFPIHTQTRDHVMHSMATRQLQRSNAAGASSIARGVQLQVQVEIQFEHVHAYGMVDSLQLKSCMCGNSKYALQLAIAPIALHRAARGRRRDPIPGASSTTAAQMYLAGPRRMAAYSAPQNASISAAVARCCSAPCRAGESSRSSSCRSSSQLVVGDRYGWAAGPEKSLSLSCRSSSSGA